MDLVTRNAMKHVYEALQVRKRMTRLLDGSTISTLKLFCNNLISECTSEKKLVLMTEKDVDDFYEKRMARETFAEIVCTKVRFS